MNVDEAIQQLRNDPAHVETVRDAYLDADWQDAANRYAESAEFAAALQYLGGVRGCVVVDVGTGRGTAAYAFVKAGAGLVVAVEPDKTTVVGVGSLPTEHRRVGIAPVVAVAERLPLPDGAADVLFCRQVLHHLADVDTALTEFGRVLKPGGRALLCREHVADTPDQLKEFFRNHPVHQLTEGEHAWPLEVYLSAIRSAGLHLVEVLGPWDTVVNAFPAVRSDRDLARYPKLLLQRRLGRLGGLLSIVPGASYLVRRRVNRPFGGRLYSFIIEQPTREVQSPRQ